LFLALFGFFSSPAYAQVNLKTGYNFSVLSGTGLDRTISDMNQAQTYQSSFSNLRWMHGIETGLRLKTGIHAFELTYQGAYQVLTAKGTSSTGENYADKIKFAVHSTALGYQISEGIFGMGTDLQYQWYRFKYEPGQSQAVYKNVQRMLGFKFYLMFTLKGDKSVDMALQPYMVLPVKDYQLDPVNHILGLEETHERDKWIRYGITILFYNGEK
jgi:hypothetical protein